ncbi:hypothetical protein [Bordetella holmesii]|nr:hypothetical protein [Bordetella holmesii]KAK79404.1 hypothetical protein L503_1553 [Bordetella holmesii CDC-H809-BH]KAK95443.1 hypothetical protein L499_A1581 [Bordetella holmesii CDC-H635-BH]KCV01273.1 hypothetical protein L498_3456 [Bordetella holmesii CDC-H629-BH]UEB21580.1 cupin [Bordetella holmesii]SUV95225.1 Uncharacterised protein [Bordetella holmesii]
MSTLLRPPQVFDSFDHFFSLTADGTLSCLGPLMRSAQAPGWLAGLKTAADTASVHGHVWERHTHGDELLSVVADHVVVHWCDGEHTSGQEDLPAGKSLLVPRGLWHRLELLCASQIFFLTPAQGGEHRKQEV